MVLVMRPSKGSGVTDWRSGKKLMYDSTAPMPNKTIIKAKAATPQGPLETSPASNQPNAQVATPITSVGPHPKCALMRAPNRLVAIVPRPKAA